jgi:hypothetical protein
MRFTSLAVAATILAAVGCGTAKPGGMSGPTLSGRMNEPPPPPSLQSNDILARDYRTNKAQVKHILIGWNDLAESYDGGIDPRAAERSPRDAETTVKEILGRLRAGADFVAMMAEYSEDRGSAESGESYEVVPGNQLVLDFRRLSLRLDVGELGVVQTLFGWHIIKRVE